MLNLKSNGIDIIGLNYKDAKSKALGWLDELGDPYSISIFDYKGDIALDMGVTGAPETFLVKNGKIVMHHLGELNKEIWEQKFEPHLLESFSRHVIFFKYCFW